MRSDSVAPTPTNGPGFVVNFSRFGKATINALSNVAFGGEGTGIPRSTLRRLEDKGLIAHGTKEGGDRFGSYSWPVWFMPLPVHVQFCAFCATLDDEPVHDQGRTR